MNKNPFQLALLGLFLLSFSSCIIVTDHPGPDGRAGDAFFGVDYDQFMPYSYWDNNPSIGLNPELGMYYPTNSGVFEFEYFINPNEYWYGVYETYRNAGGVGQPHEVPGYDGADTYLMLIINPDGFYEERGNFRRTQPDNNTLIIESLDTKNGFRIEMHKTTISERPTSNIPKMIGQK